MQILNLVTKENLSKSLDFLTSKGFLLVSIVVLITLLSKQCQKTASAEVEATRSLNNYLASMDSIRILKSEKDGLLLETSSFEKTAKELKKENADLLADLRFEKSKPPKIVIRTVIGYRDTSSGRTANTFSHPDSSGLVSFVYEPDLPGENSMRVSAEIPYSINLKDEVPLHFKKYNISIDQSIDIRAGLYRDPKDKRLYYRFFTDFPNVTLMDAQIVNVTDDWETKKALRSARKEFGVGINIGYGLGFSPSGYSVGPYIGAGLSYNPKFLQFGK